MPESKILAGDVVIFDTYEEYLAWLETEQGKAWQERREAEANAMAEASINPFGIRGKG